MRSIDTDIGRTSLAMVVGDRAIAVTSYNDGALAIVDPDGGVTEVAVLGGAGQMVARSGSDDFLVSLNNWSGNEPPPNLIVAADGSITEFTDGPVADYDIWSLRYIPATGEAVVEDSGGTYAIDAAGAARRITAGDLVAVGQNHLVVRECSEELVCIHFRIDAVTGDRQLVVVPDFEQQFRGYDPTVSVSPDGTMMTYMDWESRTAGTPAGPPRHRSDRGGRVQRPVRLRSQRGLGGGQLRALRHRRSPTHVPRHHDR